MKIITFLSTVAMLAVGPVATLSVATGVGIAAVVKAQSSAELRVSMRKLWEDHLFIHEIKSSARWVIFRMVTVSRSDFFRIRMISETP